MKEIEMILVDVGGVILLANQRITYRALQSYGIPPEQAAKFFDNEDYRNFSRGKITGREFHRSLVERHLKHDLSYEEVVEAHDAHIYELNYKVLKMVQELAGRFPIAFVTDTNPWQTRREREFIDLREISKNIVRSSRIRLLKCDEDYFPYIAQRFNLNTEEMLLIDDDRSNIQRAQNEDYQTHRFTNWKEFQRFLKSSNL